MNYFEYQKAVFASDLTYKAKLVALAIASHFNWNEETACWPADALLSQETGLSVSSVTRAKKELVAREFLDSKRRYDSTNQYLPLLPVTVPLLSQTTPSAHTEQSLCSQGPTNREHNNEENSEVNSGEELNPTPSTTAGVDDDSSSLLTKDEGATFSKIVDALGNTLDLEPLDYTDYEDWGVESSFDNKETSAPKDELELKMDEYEASARLLASYDPAYYLAWRKVARYAHDELGYYVHKACGYAYENTEVSA